MIDYQIHYIQWVTCVIYCIYIYICIHQHDLFGHQLRWGWEALRRHRRAFTSGVKSDGTLGVVDTLRWRIPMVPQVTGSSYVPRGSYLPSMFNGLKPCNYWKQLSDNRSTPGWLYIELYQHYVIIHLPLGNHNMGNFELGFLPDPCWRITHLLRRPSSPNGQVWWWVPTSGRHQIV